MKLVFSDVDSTYVHTSGKISPINIRATKALMDQGDRFVLVSGRNPEDLEVVVKEIGLEIDYIFGNGCGYKLYGQEAIYNHVMTEDNLHTLEKLFEKHDVYYHIHTSEGLVLKPIHLYDEHMENLLVMIEENFGVTGGDYIRNQRVRFDESGIFADNPFAYLREHPEIHVIKVEVCHGSEVERMALTDDANAAGFFAFSSFMNNVEIVPPNSNKGAAILEYQELFPEGKITYGFGDAENDRAMFETVDVAVAVANATEEMKALSHEQTADVLEGGVGIYIEKYLLDK